MLPVLWVYIFTEKSRLLFASIVRRHPFHPVTKLGSFVTCGASMI
jgi:hypothetical protein